MVDFNLKVLGVYRLDVTDELVTEQARILFDDGSDGLIHESALEDARAQLKSTVLLEVLVRNVSEAFDVGDFAQPNPNLPRDRWQVPWAETFLTADGLRVVVRSSRREAWPAEFRIAFFIHYWREGKPLTYKDVDVPCPAPTNMPDRLLRLVPYECVD